MSYSLYRIEQRNIENKILECVQEIVKAFEMTVEPKLLEINEKDLIGMVKRNIVSPVEI